MERFLKDLEQTTLTIFYNQNTHFDTKFIEERIILNEIKGQLKILLFYWAQIRAFEGTLTKKGYKRFL